MKDHFTLFACSVILAAPAIAADGWMTDLPAALQKARQENKLVLVDFTGSDWCGACIALRRTVLDTADFRQYAANKFVLMEVDLPRRQIDGKLRAANEAIAARYHVASYPTIMVLNPQGEVVGGFEGSVKSLKDALIPLENAQAAANIFRKAVRLSGKEKAATLMEAYRNFPATKGFTVPYEALRATIMKADPDNTTGIAEEAAAQAQAKLFLAQRNRLPIDAPAMGKLLEQQLREALPANKPDVMLECCQYAMATAETVEDIHTTRKMFDEVLPLLPPEKAAEIRHFVDTYFTDPAALLQMLKASRPR